VSAPSPPPSPGGEALTKLRLLVSGLASPWRRLDEDDADGRAAVDYERARLSTARPRQRAYSRSADPIKKCGRDGCKAERRCARAIAEELRNLKKDFNFQLEAQKKWIKHNAEREAYQQVEREQGIAKRANNRLRRAKRDVTTSRRQVGELQAQVDSLARQLAASEAELQQKSTLVEEQSAELEALGRRLGGFEHTAKRLAEYKARTVEARHSRTTARRPRSSTMRPRRASRR
jgi:chromosome segregation ATPase